MSVIVSNGNTSLATASGFVRAEAYNMGTFNAGYYDMNSGAKNIAVTFANAGNLKGIILCLGVGASANRTFTVKLQKNIASVWTDVTVANGFAADVTKTLTVAQITDSVAAGNTISDGWIVPFDFATPFAIDTAASTWRFVLSQGSGSVNWYLPTSDGTNPFFVAYCDNAVTMADNDCVVCKDKVTIDKTATIKGVLGTGDSTRGVAAVICKTSTTADPDNVANLLWQNPPSSAYTLTVDGVITVSAHGGPRCGTSSSRIPFAQQGIIDFIAPTVGSISGFTSPFNPGVQPNRKSSLFIYGEIPTYERATLNADAATGQKVIVTNESTGWAANDYVFVGRQNVKGQGDTTLYQIDTISDKTITLKTNLATNVRKAGGQVVRVNGYGFVLRGPASGTRPIHRFSCPSNVQMSGVQFQHGTFAFSYTTVGFAADDYANMAQWLFSHCSFYCPADGVALGPYFSGINTWLLGSKIEYCNFIVCIPWTLSGGNIPIIYDHNVVLSSPNAVNWSNGSQSVLTYTNNVLENTVSRGYAVYCLMPAIFTGNSFWGTGGSAVYISNVSAITWGGNTFNNCYYGIEMSVYVINFLSQGDIFGNLAANNADICDTTNGSMGIYQVEFASPVGNLVLYGGIVNAPSYYGPGSYIKITNFNSVAGDDRCYMREGYFLRCGAGLSDTTVRTAGGNALRFEPAASAPALGLGDLLTWTQTVPTGNIQGKSMTITVWVYISNSAYWAGTHTNPTLKVTYDVSTVATMVAANTAGSWQQLAVTITPTTTTPYIDVAILGMSDAASPNCRFYIDDLNINYPPGATFNLGSLDTWTHAMPVTPSIATFPSLAGIWDEATSAHGTAGSFGTLIKTDLDATVSSRSTLDAATVWAYATRSLTTFGTLVADVTTAVWAAGTRTLSSFGSLVADIATAVWAAGSRTLSSFGTLISDTATGVWGATTRTLSAFGLPVTVQTNNDKAGYSLSADQSTVTVGKSNEVGSDATEAIYQEVMRAITEANLTEQAAGAPPANPSIEKLLMYLYMSWRNQSVSTSTQRTISNDAGEVIAKAEVSDDGSTFTKEKVGAP